MLGRLAMARVQAMAFGIGCGQDRRQALRSRPGSATAAFAPRSPGRRRRMDPGNFTPALVSAGTVALAEIGDKTQLLALLLAARFRKPLPIILGILAATLLNHALAGWLGSVVAQWLTPRILRWIIVASFLAIAAWSLRPDTLDTDVPLPVHGAFLATVVAFFVAEMGDKTQVATVLLAARYSPLWQVVAGTTLGMLLANVPVVLLGSRFAERLPLRVARIAAAVLFAVLGLWVAVRGVG
jgi:putative Ca2+/H+ antiporter (TMEM165/GDT1 family)